MSAIPWQDRGGWEGVCVSENKNNWRLSNWIDAKFQKLPHSMYGNRIVCFGLALDISPMNIDELCIAPDKVLFSSEKWYFSYFSSKTYSVGTH